MIAIHYMLNSVDIIYLHKLYKQWYSIVYTDNGGIYSGTPPPLYQLSGDSSRLHQLSGD